MALDLFGDEAPPVRLLPPAPPSQVAPAAPAVPLDAVLPVAHWRHPRASRQLQLGACLVAYEFKRGKRRTIGLSVGPEGLSVRAPRWTPVAEVEALLRDKARWVLDKLQAVRERAAQTEQQRIDWRDGATLPYLGEPLCLRLDPTQALGRAGAVLERLVSGPVLRLGLPQQASADQIRDVVQAWLMREARALFEQRLAHFAPVLGVRWSRLRLSSAGTRWGSASADGGIRLNWRLIHFRLPIIDYVVAHELSHLREMNHSPQFWDTVASVMPDYAERRHALRHTPVPNW